MKPFSLLRLLAILVLVALFAPMASLKADDAYVDPFKDYDEFIFYDYTLDENIATPVVGKREHSAIVKYINRMKDQLKSNYTLDLTRDNEVLIVTLPTDELFLPNETLLTAYGINRIKPLLPYMQQDPLMFKIVYTVNTDDTGSQSYLMRLSEDRSNSFYGWLMEDNSLPEGLVVVPYPMGDFDALEPNDSAAGRAANRRIEVYFIPGPEMIQRAHEGKLK